MTWLLQSVFQSKYTKNYELQFRPVFSAVKCEQLWYPLLQSIVHDSKRIIRQTENIVKMDRKRIDIFRYSEKWTLNYKFVFLLSIYWMELTLRLWLNSHELL